MLYTEFPTRPCDVATLTVAEFTCELDLTATVSFDRVCQRFLDDVNRAVVWLIRFRALTVWRERGDIAVWLRSNTSLDRHACEAAAGFELNEAWEFHPDAFRCAVESMQRPDAQPVAGKT